MKKLLVFLAAISLFIFSSSVSAHPGNTASDGCHYCRTNCASWGEIEGARHCHGGSTSYTAPVVETAPQQYIAPTQIPMRVPTRVVIPTKVLATPTRIPTRTPTETPVKTPTLILSLIPTPTEVFLNTSSQTVEADGGNFIVRFFKWIFGR